jgi:hypothetical protein
LRDNVALECPGVWAVWRAVCEQHAERYEFDEFTA